jgi:hypothetical protein
VDTATPRVPAVVTATRAARAALESPTATDREHPIARKEHGRNPFKNPLISKAAHLIPETG